MPDEGCTAFAILDTAKAEIKAATDAAIKDPTGSLQRFLSAIVNKMIRSMDVYLTYQKYQTFFRCGKYKAKFMLEENKFRRTITKTYKDNVIKLREVKHNRYSAIRKLKQKSAWYLFDFVELQLALENDNQYDKDAKLISTATIKTVRAGEEQARAEATLLRFLSAITNTPKQFTKLPVQTVYNQYTQFYRAELCKIKFMQSQCMFYRVMKCIPGVMRHRLPNGAHYDFDIAALKMHLQEKDAYDEKAKLVSAA